MRNVSPLVATYGWTTNPNTRFKSWMMEIIRRLSKKCRMVMGIIVPEMNSMAVVPPPTIAIHTMSNGR
ncbi:MAG: hypothetical protein NTW86_10440 [Candidatus Sumerlaeota bacterium]|nr:hypothetical protein [Candidatus Sumerlaeota bacterium]